METEDRPLFWCRTMDFYNPDMTLKTSEEIDKINQDFKQKQDNNKSKSKSYIDIIYDIMNDIIKKNQIESFVKFLDVLHEHGDNQIRLNIPLNFLLLLHKYGVPRRREILTNLNSIGTELPQYQIDILIPTRLNYYYRIHCRPDQSNKLTHKTGLFSSYEIAKQNIPREGYSTDTDNGCKWYYDVVIQDNKEVSDDLLSKLDQNIPNFPYTGW